MSTSDRPPKETLADRYRIDSILGRGGMGSVWLGEHLALGTPVAIKLLERRLAEKPRLRARFLREARAAASLRSKNVVQILDHGVDGDIPFIVMELLHGESLGERLRRVVKLDPGELATVLTAVGRAIARAHKAGIVHRDLKPDNVFIAQDEDGETVKVVDFGIAKILDEEISGDLSTDTGALLGTPYYMSPEQARGMKPIDTRADLWAIAVIAFECCTGRRPFVASAVGELVLQICATEPPKPSEVGPVPAGFDEWFERATRRAIGERFQSVEELIGALLEVLTPGVRTTIEPVTDPGAPGFGGGAPEARPGRSAPSGAESTPSQSRSPDATPTRIASGTAETVLADESGATPVETQDSAARSLPPDARPSRRPLGVVAGVAAIAATGAIAFWATRPPPSAPQTPGQTVVTASATTTALSTPASGALASTNALAAPVSVAVEPVLTTIKLTFSSKPPDADVYRGKERIGSTADGVELARGDTPIELTVRRKGYAPFPLKLTPTADRQETVVLKPADKDYEF